MTSRRPIRLEVLVEDIEADIIDSWGLMNDMPNRASAMRELVRRGLSEEGTSTPLGGIRGVVHSPQTR